MPCYDTQDHESRDTERACLDKVTHLLCSTLRALEAGKTSGEILADPETAEWFALHKDLDTAYGLPSPPAAGG